MSPPIAPIEPLASKNFGFQDGFESGDLSAWEETDGDEYEVTSLHANSGSFSARNINVNQEDRVLQLSGSGGLEYAECWLYHDSGIDSSGGGGPILARSARDSWINGRIGANDNLEIVQVLNGGRTTRANTAITFNSNTWYKVSLEHTGSGEYTANFYGTTPSTVDATASWSNGPVPGSTDTAGVRARHGSASFVDDVVARDTA